MTFGTARELDAILVSLEEGPELFVVAVGVRRDLRDQ